MTFDLSALRKTRWYEYGVRWFFGGAITVIAGFLAKKYGPTVGGLFLAFPAIFPASATLVAKHEGAKRQKAGSGAITCGRQAAALDAYGAALGSVGLIGFALAVWKLLPHHNAVSVLTAATVTWISISMALWRCRKRRLLR